MHYRWGKEEKMSKFENNLVEGRVAKQLILFSLPVLISNLIQTLYSVADMIIVGQFCGSASMAARLPFLSPIWCSVCRSARLF